MVMTTTTTTDTGDQARAESGCGLPSDQVHDWLDRVGEDLRKVRARLEYLRAEQARLESQQQLLAELLASSSAV